MKTILLFILLQISQNSFCQNNEPFFEQIAFDFYRTEILNSYPVKKRIRVNKYTWSLHGNRIWFYTPKCLLNISWKSNDQFKKDESYFERQMDISSDKFELHFTNLDKKQFKIKKNGKGKYPRLLISLPHKEDTNNKRIFVNLYEEHSKTLQIIYHFEFDKKGEIIEWCRTESKMFVVH